MSLAELVITSVTVERRSKSEVARDYRISRYWVQTLVKRYEAEGEAAFEPRSRRPHPTRVRSASTWKTRSSGCAKSCPSGVWMPALKPSAPTFRPLA
ncbi:MAG: helix-turn-helix domain-containing protein [Actinomycetales bacterium]|nr:helix-turn-helix domain-containing protein [Actinomycetales bacterium]